MSKKLKKNVPVLRFPEFQDNWEQNSLKKVTIKIGSGATPTGGDSNYKKSGISLFRSLNVYDNFFKIDNLAYIDDDQAKKLDNVAVDKGDILLNITGASIARCCIAPIDFLPARVNQHVMIIRPNYKDIRTEFIAFLLICHRYKKKLFQLGGKGGSTREALTKEHIENFEIFYPSIAEQEKMASFLGAIANRLTQLRRKQELLQTYKRGVMQKIFSQQIRFKQDDGSDFPAWQKKKLGELGTLLGGGTPRTSQSNHWIGDIPWISSSDLEEDSIYKISITRFINEIAIKESATKIILPKSLLIVSRVGVGKIAVSEEELCTSQDFYNFTPNKGNVYFLAYWFLAYKKKVAFNCTRYIDKRVYNLRSKSLEN